mgnify:CR=1 FL=1
MGRVTNTTTTSTDWATLIAEGDPLTPKDWNEQKELELREKYARGAERCKEAFSSSLYYKARGEKDPDYWRGLFGGRVNW